MVEKTKGRKEEVVAREYTINLHKRLHGWLPGDIAANALIRLGVLENSLPSGQPGRGKAAYVYPSDPAYVGAL